MDKKKGHTLSICVLPLLWDAYVRVHMYIYKYTYDALNNLIIPLHDEKKVVIYFEIVSQKNTTVYVRYGTTYMYGTVPRMCKYKWDIYGRCSYFTTY